MTDRPLDVWLARLADALPPPEAKRVVPEVKAMILDRAEAELAADASIDQAEAERRALEGWEAPDELAEQLVKAPLTIDLATRRTFFRGWMALFAGHLVLSIVLSLAGSKGAVIPGLLGPLPTESFAATALGVLSVFLIDAGLMLVLFLLLGKGRMKARVPHLDLSIQWTRREALKGLILIVLVAVIFNVFLDSIVAIRQGDRLVPILSDDMHALLPLLNIVLALFAIRHVLTLAGRANRAEAAAFDAVASLSAVILLLLAATRSDLVTVPEDLLGPGVSAAFEDTLERVLMLVFVVASLFMALRFVKQSMRTVRLLQGASS